MFNMTIRETSFGTLEPLIYRDNQVALERGIFEREGRNHTHDLWEICYVIGGKGAITCGDAIHKVGPASIVAIPPNTEHRMIPEQTLDIIIAYSRDQNENYDL